MRHSAATNTLLPTEDDVPATIKVLDLMLELDAPLSAYALLFEWMLDQRHLGHEVRVINQFGGRIAAGDDEVKHCGLVFSQPRHDLARVQPAVVHHVGELIQQKDVVVEIGRASCRERV